MNRNTSHLIILNGSTMFLSIYTRSHEARSKKLKQKAQRCWKCRIVICSQMIPCTEFTDVTKPADEKLCRISI